MGLPKQKSSLPVSQPYSSIFFQHNLSPLTSYNSLVLLVPLAWLLGFDFLFPFFLIMYAGFRFQKLKSFELFIVALGLWLQLSVLMSGSSDVGRILSSYYSSFLLIALALVHANFRSYCSNSSVDQILQFIRKVYQPIFYMCVAFAMFALLLGFGFGVYELKFKTLLGIISPVELPGIADRSMIAEIIRPDWGFGSFPMPRPMIFSPWYTAGAMLVACTGLLTLSYASQRRNGPYKELFVEALLVLTIFITLSRTTLLMYIIGFVFVSFLLKDSKRILIVIVASLLLTAYFMTTLDLVEITSFRSYSNESRLTAYIMGINLALNESVLFGYGVKPRVDGLSIPIGSHSSWISFFVRGGVVGVILFACWMYIIPMLNLVRKFPTLMRLDYKKRMMVAGPLRFQLLTFGWVFLQEIDTAALAVTMLFVSLALSHALFNKLFEVEMTERSS